jgi:hypothetical protein
MIAVHPRADEGQLRPASKRARVGLCTRDLCAHYTCGAIFDSPETVVNRKKGATVVELILIWKEVLL